MQFQRPSTGIGLAFYHINYTVNTGTEGFADF